MKYHLLLSMLFAFSNAAAQDSSSIPGVRLDASLKRQGDKYYHQAIKAENQKNFAEAEKSYLAAKQIFKSYCAKGCTEYFKSVSALAKLYRDRSMYKASKSEYLLLKDALSSSIGKENKQYVECLNALGLLRMDMEQFSKADKCFEEALNIQEIFLENGSSEMASTLNNLANLYRKQGKYEPALKYYLQTLQIRAKNQGTLSDAYTTTLLGLASFYKELGKYEAAEAAILEVKELRAKKYGKVHPYYATCLLNLATLYEEMKIYDAAIALNLEVNAIRKIRLGPAHQVYASGLHRLANLYVAIGNFEEALNLYQEAKEILNRGLTKDTVQYVDLLNNLAQTYLYQANIAKAKTCLEEAAPILDSTLGRWTTQKVTWLYHSARLNSEMGAMDAAEANYIDVVEILKELYGKQHYKYAEGLSRLGLSYQKNGQFKKADAFLKESMRIRKKIFGDTHLHYLYSLEQLADLYEVQNKYSKSELLLLELSQAEQERLKLGATFLSERELSYFTASFSEKNTKIANYRLLRPEEKASGTNLSSILLNNVIFIKGFLLTNAAKLNKLHESSPETNALKITLMELQRRLAVEYSKPKFMQIGVNELEHSANKIEKKLRKVLRGYAEATRKVAWPNVQEVLKINEAAIELVHFEVKPSNGIAQIVYAALVVRPDDDKVGFFPLCTAQALDSLIPFTSGRKADYVNALYSISDRGAVPIEAPKRSLYEMLWKPLEKELAGINTIYFSPSGLLHRINLNAIPISATETLADRFNLIELNSTRQLVSPTPIKNINNDAVLFGGIQFEQDSLWVTHAPLIGLRSIGELSFQAVDSTLRGGTWRYLAGTEVEVNSIQKIMKTAGIQTNLKRGFQATEESFKNIGTGNSTSPRILHIATHGYFFPDPKSSEKKSNLNGELESVFKISDHPMLRSGLIMAGGNAAWQGKQTLEGREDGILTAYEISQMNLSNTELVVLSACETGLGDIQGNEGVYGLQRAFKIAGAKYLIMSLWQVPDKQTSLLMTTFYKKWLEEKMKIPDAFHAAQKELRDNGLDPYNWAGFVLVE